MDSQKDLILACYIILNFLRSKYFKGHFIQSPEKNDPDNGELTLGSNVKLTFGENCSFGAHVLYLKKEMAHYLAYQ